MNDWGKDQNQMKTFPKIYKHDDYKKIIIINNLNKLVIFNYYNKIKMRLKIML